MPELRHGAPCYSCNRPASDPCSVCRAAFTDETDAELPGMWERADFEGGQTDSRPERECECWCNGCPCDDHERPEPCPLCGHDLTGTDGHVCKITTKGES